MDGMCVVFAPDDTTRPAFEAPCPILTLFTEITQHQVSCSPALLDSHPSFLAALDELFLAMDTALLLAMYMWM
jgi:hypothetical protein